MTDDDFNELVEFVRAMHPIYEHENAILDIAERISIFGWRAVLGDAQMMQIGSINLPIPFGGPREYDDDGVRALADAALAGNPHAEDLLRSALADLVKSGRVPAAAHAYLAQMLSAGGTIAKRKRGPNARDTLLRRSAHLLVRAVMELDPEIKLTHRRQPKTERRSACTVVREVLAEAGIHRDTSWIERAFYEVEEEQSTSRN